MDLVETHDSGIINSDINSDLISTEPLVYFLLSMSVIHIKAEATMKKTFSAI